MQESINIDTSSDLITDDTKTENTKILSLKELHLIDIESRTENSKDRSLYESYDYHISGHDSNIQIFSARKRGEGHIRNQQPCQDYCLTVEDDICTILAMSDGVSSCANSDVGARLACEAVVKTVQSASQYSESEEQLVSLLKSVQFRDKLVASWNLLVSKEISKTESKIENYYEEFSTYGATIMFAIITNNYYVTGNLGDGQIIVFNDNFGIKLRVHTPKESSGVRCLINETCVLEDFQVGAYPRVHFNGVLLSTDGMYESLDKNTHFYNYAQQLKTRFCNLSIPEPIQPFCYLEKGEPFKDFSIFRTFDDCSIILAIDQSLINGDIQEIHQTISDNSEDMIPGRYEKDCLTFFVISDGEYFDAVVTSKSDIVALPKLMNAVIQESSKTLNRESYKVSFYEPSKGESIESMYSNGKLRRKSHQPIESSKMILRLYRLLVSVQKELIELGYTLNELSHILVTYDGEILQIRKEAISIKTCMNNSTLPYSLESLFFNMIGILETQDSILPIFGIGYFTQGLKMNRIDKYGSEQFCQLVKEGNEYRLKNIGSLVWHISSTENVSPGQTIELLSGLTFSLLNTSETDSIKYKFTSRENL
jgi:hypothetical protein